MDRVRISVDFNEMVDEDTVMLSQTDVRIDDRGDEVVLYEGMPVTVFERDDYGNGEMDFLVADGVVLRHDLEAYPFFEHVRWFCRMDLDSFGNRPEAAF